MREGATPSNPSPVRLGLVIGQLTIGGAERQLWEVARGLAPGFTPIVYGLAEVAGPLASELERNGILVRTIGARGLGRARRLAQALREDRVDVVHAWLYIANAYAWLARCCGARQPLITSARNCKVQGQVSRLLNMFAFRASRCIVANSDDVATYIRRQYRAPAGRIRVVYNGIDTARFHPPMNLPVTAGAATIVTVGRLVFQKNHELFLQAAARLRRELYSVRFIVVGEGPLRADLEARAQELGIGASVQFAGERGDVDEILRGASLFWLTSRWEGMPNVVLEALASGVPVIATDVGGSRELVRVGIDGFVVAPGDAEGFVVHSKRLLLDSALRRRFGDCARARAEEFSTCRMVAQMTRLYEEVVR